MEEQRPRRDGTSQTRGYACIRWSPDGEIEDHLFLSDEVELVSLPDEAHPL